MGTMLDGEEGVGTYNFGILLSILVETAEGVLEVNGQSLERLRGRLPRHDEVGVEQAPPPRQLGEDC